jgi:hypothetical protein
MAILKKQIRMRDGRQTGARFCLNRIEMDRNSYMFSTLFLVAKQRS